MLKLTKFTGEGIRTIQHSGHLKTLLTTPPHINKILFHLVSNAFVRISAQGDKAIGTCVH